METSTMEGKRPVQLKKHMPDDAGGGEKTPCLVEKRNKNPQVSLMANF
jgi:hypothetical protein